MGNGQRQRQAKRQAQYCTKIKIVWDSFGYEKAAFFLQHEKWSFLYLIIVVSGKNLNRYSYRIRDEGIWHLDISYDEGRIRTFGFADFLGLLKKLENEKFVLFEQTLNTLTP